MKYYSIISSNNTPKMVKLYQDILNKKFKFKQLKGNKMWTDYDILIDLKAIPLNFGKQYTLYKSPYKDVIQNNKNAYIGSTPVDSIIANKHIMDYNTLSFYPKSFNINYEDSKYLIKLFDLFILYKNKYYIIKPSFGSGGKDIIVEYNEIVNAIKDYKKDKYPLVIQRYITNPLLLNGYKFDFRVYVLYIDNKVYVNKHFITRLAGKKYNYNKPYDIKAGLTNFSLHKNFSLILSETEFYKKYKKEYKNDRFNYLNDKLLKKIIKLVKKFFTFIRKEIKMDFWKDKKNHYFNLFGFDILPDDKGKLWLLEVNKKPLLKWGKEYSKEEYMTELVEDMINIILKKNQSSFIEV